MDTYNLYSLVYDNEDEKGYVGDSHVVKGKLDDYNGVVTTEQGDNFKNDEVIIVKGGGYYITQSNISDEEAFATIKNALTAHFEHEIASFNCMLESLNQF